MAQITSELIKELRERTGVGMGKCKEALEQTSGDLEKAIDFLRKSGMAAAVKKEGRETKEGLIGAAEGKQAIAVVELSAETDFVTQNERFKTFLRDLCDQAAETRPATLEAFLQQPFHKDRGLTVDQYRATIVQSLGENIQIKRVQAFSKSSTISWGIYSHMGGKIVTIVELTGGTGQEALARDIAMHIAAESPDYLRPQDVPADVKAREEDVARSQITGKPANIIDKIVEGKLKAFYDQACLMCQKYIKDNAISIQDLIDKESKRLGQTLSIHSFMRWRVGA